MCIHIYIFICALYIYMHVLHSRDCGTKDMTQKARGRERESERDRKRPRDRDRDRATERERERVSE